MFVQVVLLVFVFQILNGWNQWPSVQAGFSTSEPLSHQLMISDCRSLGGRSPAGALVRLGYGVSCKDDSKASEWMPAFTAGSAAPAWQ